MARALSHLEVTMAQLAANPASVNLATDTIPTTVFTGRCKIRNVEWSGYTAAPAVFPKITDINGKFIVQFNVDTATDVEEKRSGNIGWTNGLVVNTSSGAASTGIISVFFE
jgi:hypothetical protein